MTESEWAACADPQQMLAFLKGRASPRKFRLFAVECCRQQSHLLIPQTLADLEVAEGFAEGKITQLERCASRHRAFAAGWNPNNAFAHRRGPAKACVTAALARKAWEGAMDAARIAAHIGALTKTAELGSSSPPLTREEASAGFDAAKQEQQIAYAEVIRDIFGNPFSLPSLERDWSSQSVVGLAGSIYATRDFDRLPELGNLLEAAGCEDERILAHCRSDLRYARGCWVIDTIVGLQ